MASEAGSRASRFNRSAYCRPCQSKYTVGHRKKARNRQRAEILAAYGGKCAHCGFDDPRALVIDHVNDNGAEERRNGLGHPNKLYGHIVREGFPDSYQILCANCNSIKEFERSHE